MQTPVLPQVLGSALQRHPWVTCQAQHLAESVNSVTPVDLMHCLKTAAHGSPATPAVAQPAALADASLKTLPYVSPATVSSVNPVAAAVQSCESQCQEPVPWQAQRCAFDTVDNLTPCRAHKVVFTTRHYPVGTRQ